MPVLASVSTCTGCAACANACAKSAIDMVPKDVLGHLFPVVDSRLCVDCGLCSKSCPVITPVTLRKPDTAYAAWAKDEQENRSSTSGGVASVLTRYVLSQGGVVYGCASEGIDVLHIRVDDESGIDKLRGSKYVQSNIGFCYKNVKADLCQGLQVLFIGTPCQVAGLRCYLRRNYENLITVDLICHGTPSLDLLHRHLECVVENVHDIGNVSFRQGTSYRLMVTSKNSDLLYSSNLWKERYKDAFYSAFMAGYICRQSCNNCSYANVSRCSDVTIGDFWGLGKYKPFKPQAKAYGYSLVLPNTDKGMELIKKVDDLLYMQERDVEEAVKGNDQLRKPKHLSFSGKCFQKMLECGFSLKTSLYFADWYKIPVYKLLNIYKKL